MVASKYSNTFSTIETVKLLLDAGANVNLQDKEWLDGIDDRFNNIVILIAQMKQSNYYWILGQMLIYKIMMAGLR